MAKKAKTKIKIKKSETKTKNKIKTKYIFVCGGVMSGVGKGITTASIGKLLQSKGFSVTAIKIDPYVNVDAGTMNPTEHGEVFVTEDGDETDQDIGNYERFMNINILRDNYMTTGRVYQSVIAKERALAYGGKCVEVIPHITDEVIERIKKAGRKNKADFVMVEIGGTVGEYQNSLFLEAARMMHLKEPNNVLFVLVSYLPIPSKVGEMKTKPTQNACRTVNSVGIQPDFIIARSSHSLDNKRKGKVSVYCNVAPGEVISAPDVDSIYDIPINFSKEKLGNKILDKFDLEPAKKNMQDWMKMANNIRRLKKEVKIGIVGKYFASGKFILSDSYISVIEAIKHAAWHNKAKPVIEWLDSEVYEKTPKALKELNQYDGIVVPGGFGGRGIEGKIKAIGYARENQIPFLGLCYGLQLAVIEFAKNVAKIKDANSTEINPKAKNPVIHIMDEQAKKLAESQYGNTMRLGAWPCVLNKNSRSFKAYGQKRISERHRHRYEVNNQYRDKLEKAGLLLAGLSPDGKLVEIVELLKHPFFVATQFHPEFKSRFLNPHPLFNEMIKSALKRKNKGKK